MLFKHLKQIAEKNLDSGVVDCVIGIPSYFTDLQRRLYLDAAHIAGLTPLSLLHDGTSIALGYDMYKTDFSNSGPTNVMFMKVLCHSFDQNLGGRDFDEVLFKHFAAQFNEKYKIDVYSNARAFVRLRTSCEKVKKVLSANAEASLSIECLIGDTVKEPTRTLNASKSVARGCALRCAMLTPTLPVLDYKIGPSEPSGAEKGQVKLKVKLNDHGIVKFRDSKQPSIGYYTNADVSTTNDELHEARERKYAGRTRYKGPKKRPRSFVTDTEKEDITNNLQETENWLNEDSDDKSEQDYTGTLKDLKRVSGKCYF
ncbi:putative Heat shock protein 70 family [Helianthus anomalus]